MRALRYVVYLSLALSLAAPAAMARGVLLSPEDLDPAARDALGAEIAAARETIPELFRGVSDLRALLAEIDAAKRGRLPILLPSLQALGSEALLPMLQEIAFDAADRGALPDSAWIGWRAGLLEAVGKLRDLRAAPVLNAVITKGPAQLLVTSAAAAALGKLLTDEAATSLIGALVVSDGERRLGILRGMGHCRRASAVDALAAALRARPDAEEALIVAKSLGYAGSSWAWRTPVVAATGEEDAVRRIAAEALAEMWPAYDGHVQKSIGHALLVVEHPKTAALLRAAAGDDPTLLAVAEKLIERLKK
jgi:hypothetical protein